MKDARKERSAVVKAGMERVCSDFTKLVASLGFVRTNSRSRTWTYRGDKFIRVIYFHRGGSTYGAPSITPSTYASTFHYRISTEVHRPRINSQAPKFGTTGAMRII